MLSQDIERYIDLKRATGYTYRRPEILLKQFAAYAGAFGDDFVRTQQVYDWAVEAPSPDQRRRRLLTVRRFALMMRAEDERHEVPAADAFGRATIKRRPPHIYTAEEITQLMDAAAMMGPKGSIRPLTYVTMFGLLITTGLRISEVLALKINDFTEDGLIIRKTKFGKSRLVPLHETTRRAVSAYLASRMKIGAISDSLFVSTSGQAPAYRSVDDVFLRLSASIGLRNGNGRQPRIHDLRHTFAVRSLEQCPHDREAVSRHMAALSTYLGHTSVQNTYWYLEATPSLLTYIAEAGEGLYAKTSRNEVHHV